MNKYWQQLAPRDRKILLGSLPVVIILVVLLAARPLVKDRARATEELDRALEDLAWLQAQQEAMALPDKGCSGSAWTDDGIESLARQYGVEISPPEPRGGESTLTLDAAHGNRVIAMLRELECRGARVDGLELNTLDEDGTVSGRASLQIPVT